MLAKLGKTARGGDWLRQIGTAVLAVALALFTGAVVILLTGANPIAAYAAILYGAFGNLNNISETVVKAAPLVLAACWYAMEFLMARWFSGFGWGALGYSQGPLPSLARWAAPGGVEFVFGQSGKSGEFDEIVDIGGKAGRELLGPPQPYKRDPGREAHATQSAQCRDGTEHVAQHQRTKHHDTSRL